MGANERRVAIWHTLCRQRQVTITQLAEKYSVSPRTIRYDIEALSRVYPIETRLGKNGGIKVADWFQSGDEALRPEQMELLMKIYQQLDGEDAIIMRGIIDTLRVK